MKALVLHPDRRPRCSLCEVICSLALVLFLCGGALPGAQETRDTGSFLVGMLLKTWTLRERAAADIEVNSRELQVSEAKFQEAEKRMTNAAETYNDQAIFAAREPLRSARADLKKLRQTRARLDLAMTRAEASYAALKNLLVSGQDNGPSFLLCGLVSLDSGKTEILRKDGKKITLNGAPPRFLEPGDEIITSGGSSAELLVLDGRAAVRLGEKSRLRLKEESPQEQVLELIQGKIYVAVDKLGDFTEMLQGNAQLFEADKEVKEVVASTLERNKEWPDKKFTVRTPSACCSSGDTKSSIGLISSGGTEFAIFEGAVDVGDANCANKVPVEEGFKVIVTKNGISEPAKIADIDRWWEK